MLCIKATIKETKDKGKGLFSLQFIPKGKVIIISAHQDSVISEQEYQERQENGDDLILKTAARLVEDFFIHSHTIEQEDCINHSRDPSMLYHCGIYFATRDISPGEELTINYAYALAEEDATAFIHPETGELVDGMNATQALLESAKQLVQMLEEVTAYRDHCKTKG